MLPTTNLPSYSSEDAVLSVVNAELLKLLFPTSAAEFAQHQQDQQEAAMLSGRASASDITAGIGHGQRIAAYTVAFAKGDGAR